MINHDFRYVYFEILDIITKTSNKIYKEMNINIFYVNQKWLIGGVLLSYVACSI